MTARILIVGKAGESLSSIERQLAAEDFQTLTSTSHEAAVDLARSESPDVILGDCPDRLELLKDDAVTARIPFLLTSGVDRAALLARLRPMLRLKALSDEIRARGATSGLMGAGPLLEPVAGQQGAIVAVIDDGSAHIPALLALLRGFGTVITLPIEHAAERLRQTPCNIVLLRLAKGHVDGLRLVARLRTQAESRRLPILAWVDGDAGATLAKGFAFGIDDTVHFPEDRAGVAEQVQLLLHHRRQSDRLRQTLRSSMRLAATDAVTGLYHRHYMTQHLSNLIVRARAHSRPLSLLLIDIDGFRQVNELVGHAGGDAVLRDVATRIMSSVRAGDLSARCGGQRFAVVLPNGGGEVAGIVAERLRVVIGDLPVQGRAVTASIGIASLRSEDDGAEAMLTRADEALFAAKHIGRNRVVGGAQEAAA